jgi:acylphosphatase
MTDLSPTTIPAPDPAERARLHLTVTGRVQGVYYRASAAQRARELGLAGWVRNLPDGGVEALAEGPRADLEAFVAWCRRGPPAARVDALDASWSAPAGEAGDFAIRR